MEKIFFEKIENFKILEYKQIFLFQKKKKKIKFEIHFIENEYKNYLIFLFYLLFYFIFIIK